MRGIGGGFGRLATRPVSLRRHVRSLVAGVGFVPEGGISAHCISPAYPPLLAGFGGFVSNRLRDSMSQSETLQAPLAQPERARDWTDPPAGG